MPHACASDAACPWALTLLTPSRCRCRHPLPCCPPLSPTHLQGNRWYIGPLLTFMPPIIPLLGGLLGVPLSLLGLLVRRLAVVRAAASTCPQMCRPTLAPTPAVTPLH